LFASRLKRRRQLVEGVEIDQLLLLEIPQKTSAHPAGQPGPPLSEIVELPTPLNHRV
jgi:hypothetical protein